MPNDIHDIYLCRARRNDRTGAIEMKGTFLRADTLSGWRFVPDDTGPATMVIPVFTEHGLEDVVAVGADAWGTVTGKATHLGTGNRVHHSPASWLAGEDAFLRCN